MIPAGSSAPDEITVAVEASPLCEMLLSLESLSMPRCPNELAESAGKAFGAGFRDRINELYGAFAHGTMFMEFALGWEDHEDVPAFLDWVAGLEEREFAWYILGRIMDMDKLPARLTPANLASLIRSYTLGEMRFDKWYINFDWAEDISGFRDGLVSLWRHYWDRVFRFDVEKLRPKWEAGIRPREAELRESGYREYYLTCAGNKEFPEPLPEDIPYRHLSFIPSCRTPHTGPVTFFGYGFIKVIFSCEIQEEDIERFHQFREELITGFKSLGDETRLKVFKLVALNEKVVNGKWLAARLKVSPSVVSRHLTQLKAAGFIGEFSEDNRNITYAVNWEKVKNMSEGLESYLLGSFPKAAD